MEKRMITREEIRNLKRRRKRKIRLMYYSILSLLVICGLFIFILRCRLNGSKLKGKEIEIGVNPNLGYREGSELAATNTDAPGSDYYNKYASRPDADFEYILPETELADVSTIEGYDYANEEVFGKNSSEPIALQYFEDAVFIGDSRTEGLVLYSDLININSFSYKGLNVGKLTDEPCINVPGIGDNLTCYEAIAGKVYDFYYCMFGINELGWPTAESFIDYFNDLIDYIYEVNPDAVVYVPNIISVSKEKSDSDEIFNIERVNEFNSALLEMCKQRGDVIYLDINSVVTNEEGYLPEEATFDGIHLYGKYCKRVIQYMRSNTYYRK